MEKKYLLWRFFSHTPHIFGMISIHGGEPLSATPHAAEISVRRTMVLPSSGPTPWIKKRQPSLSV
jgi:hypothetical protein